MKTTLKIRNLLSSPTPDTRLSAVFIISLLLLVSFLLPVKKEPVPGRDNMVNASVRMKSALNMITQFRQEKKLEVDPLLDPNKTGWIGAEFTPITTTLGNPQSKQTALNPDFAALITLWLINLNVQKGDTVALQMSGSFPALNIASIIACEELQAYPLISSSVGASSFGANLPEFTYLDIEKRLFDLQMIHHRSSLVTCGGNEDKGTSLWEGGDSLIRKAAERNNYSIVEPVSFEAAVARKWIFFHSGHNIKAFINVGGNHSALGDCAHSTNFPTGLIQSFSPCQDAERGLLMYFAEKRIPVIHLLDIRSLAVQNGLPVAPSPLPPAGTADIYFQAGRSKLMAIAMSIILLACWVLLYNPYSIPFSFRTISTRSR